MAASLAFLSLALATSFIARVIFRVFVTEVIRRRMSRNEGMEPLR